ncbi:MAG: CrcB family protein [Actinomycetota bacterium]|nr:CrcB family protein [Actinomycetota bacterium]
MPAALPVDPDPAAPPGAQHPRLQLHVVAAVAIGGALGAPARYGVERLLPAAPEAFPWATLLTNASGCLLLGVLLVLVHDRWPPTRYARPFLATGFLGAYTTFSSYALQVDLLVKDGHPSTAAAYAASSLLTCLGLAWLGIAIGRRLAGPAGRRGIIR